jgi:hypothetical protein
MEKNNARFQILVSQHLRCRLVDQRMWRKRNVDLTVRPD